MFVKYGKCFFLWSGNTPSSGDTPLHHVVNADRGEHHHMLQCGSLSSRFGYKYAVSPHHERGQKEKNLENGEMAMQDSQTDARAQHEANYVSFYQSCV